MAEPGLTLDRALEHLREAERLRKENRLAFFRAYPKQAQFFAMGKAKRERLLSGGNKVGKTEAGSFECACHLTGIYPRDWRGRRFSKPTKGWICGESSLVVRDVQQKKLCGEPGVEAAFGTGMIPKELFLERPSLARGITDAYDTMLVRHVSGGVSIARFKSYEQGRSKFQAESCEWIWNDEEPDEDVYGEELARLVEGGIIFTTFTPLKGRSKVVLRFMQEASEDRGMVILDLADAEHFSEEEKRRRTESYAEHERDARVHGIPTLGSGAVYPFAGALIAEPRIDIVPAHWAKLWAIDFGIEHPFAAVLGAWDKDVDCLHILHAIRMKGEGASLTPLNHAAAMRAVAAGVPVAWPHDGHARDKGSGETLAAIYRGHGLSMLASHATWEDGGFSREAAVTEITERAKTGRFKVASHLSEWFEEFRIYHRKDGKIVAVEDDLMSATEKLVMAKRFGRPVALGSKVAKRRPQAVAHGVDEEYFGF